MSLEFYSQDEISDDSYLQLCRDEYEHIWRNIPDLPFGNICRYLGNSLRILYCI